MEIFHLKYWGSETFISGYEMNWAAFHIVEIMASTKLRYLIFHDDTNSLLNDPKMEQPIISKVPPLKQFKLCIKHAA